MDLDISIDVVKLDAELLQLPEVSPLAIKANPYVAEKLFDQWLPLPETDTLVDTNSLEDIFGNIDEDGSDEPDEDDCFDPVCAICDNGGNLYICDGKCMRSFHATVEDGEDSQCRSLGYTDEQLEEIKDVSFICKNCKYKRHQCFACGKLGSSDESSGPEVFCCANGACGYFYHPECVAKLLHPGDGAAAEEHRQKIAAGEKFACPAHSCVVCKELEVRSTHELQFAVCRRCPRAYHRKCLPREIALEDDDYFEQRAWEGLLPKRILIYCLNHEIDPDISTPIRNHIKFPGQQREEKNNVPLENIKKKKPAEKKPLEGVHEVSCYPKQSVLSRRRVEEPHAAKLQRPTNRSYPEKLKEPTTDKNNSLGKKLYDAYYATDAPVKSNKGGSAHCDEKTRVKPAARRTSTYELDDDTKKRIGKLMKDASLSVTLDQVKEGYKSSSTTNQSSKFSADYITLGKVEKSVQSLRDALKQLEEGCIAQDAKMVCGNDILKLMLRWKDKMRVYLSPFLHGPRYTSFGRHFTKTDRLKEVVNMLHWYFEDGDMLVDFCCGSNDFSLLMKKKLDEMGKRCSFKNYDLVQPKNDFNFEVRNWFDVSPEELPRGSKLIIGLNPPFGLHAALANKFINKALEFKPKLIVLIVPRETERLDRKDSRYDLIWEDGQLCSGKSFYLPGSIDIHDKEIEDWNKDPPVLYLWSNPSSTSKHRSIAKNHSHPSSAEKCVEENRSDTQEKNQNPGNNNKTSAIKVEEGLLKPERPEQEKARERDSNDKKNKDRKSQDSSSSDSKRKRKNRPITGHPAKRPTTHEHPSHVRHQQLGQVNFPPYHHQQHHHHHQPSYAPPYIHESVDEVARRYNTMGGEETQLVYDNNSNRSSPYMNEAPNSWNQRSVYPTHQSYIGPGFQQSSFVPPANPNPVAYGEMERYRPRMEGSDFHGNNMVHRQGMGMPPHMQDGYHGRNSRPQTLSPLDYPPGMHRYSQHSSGWLNN